MDRSIWAEGKLWQGLVPSAAATKLYTPKLTSNGQVKIENIFLANTHTAAVQVYLWAGSTATLDRIIFPGTLMDPHTLWVPKVVLYVGAGESIWGQATVDAVVNLTLNGGVRQ